MKRIFNHPTLFIAIVILALCTSFPTVGSAKPDDPLDQGMNALLFTFPSNGSVASRDIGLKGITLFYADALPPIPAASITMTIDGGSAINCVSVSDAQLLGATPPPGDVCWYAVIDDFLAPGNAINETIGVKYGGFFPADVSVEVSQSGVDDVPASSITFTTNNLNPRDPFSLAMVIDRSGSMAGRTDPNDATSPTKIDAMELAGNIFYDTIAPYTLDDDRTGLVFFEGDAVHVEPDGSNFLVPFEDANVTAITDEIDAAVAGGSTSIGDGLKLANTQGFSGDANPRKIAVVLTDGYQNTPDLIEDDPGSDFWDASTRNLVIGGAPYPEDIDIHVISIGLGTAARRDFNSALSLKRSGFDTFDVSDLSGIANQTLLIEHYMTVMEDAVVGDKLEQVRALTGQLLQNNEQVIPFVLSDDNVRLTINLLWDNPQIRAIPMRLRAPDGTEVRVGNYGTLGDGYLVINLPLPLFSQNIVETGGTWELVLNPNNRGPATEFGLIIQEDNMHIATVFGFEGKAFETGQTIPIKATLTENALPVTGATVSVAVSAPSDHMGNILSESDSPSFDGGGKDPLSPAELKLGFLLDDPATKDLLLGRRSDTVVLSDPDNDGVYTGTYRNTNEEGIYNFRFMAEGTAPISGRYVRAQTLPVHVRSRPDPDAMEASTSLSENILTLTLTPRDGANNLLGPGYENLILVNTSAGSLNGPVIDQLDGSYIQRITLPNANSDPDIEVIITGTTVIDAPASAIGGAGGIGFARASIGVHGGLTNPRGSAGLIYDDGLSLGADFDYRLFGNTTTFHAGVALGYDAFKSQGTVGDTHIVHGSVFVKAMQQLGNVLGSIRGGVGAYLPKDGDLVGGFNVGLGIGYVVSPTFMIEARGDSRNVDGGVFEYSSIQIGVRIGL